LPLISAAFLSIPFREKRLTFFALDMFTTFTLVALISVVAGKAGFDCEKPQDLGCSGSNANHGCCKECIAAINEVRASFHFPPPTARPIPLSDLVSNHKNQKKTKKIIFFSSCFSFLSFLLSAAPPSPCARTDRTTTPSKLG
jgi:hypothetical protein